MVKPQVADAKIFVVSYEYVCLDVVISLNRVDLLLKFTPCVYVEADFNEKLTKTLSNSLWHLVERELHHMQKCISTRLQ